LNHCTIAYTIYENDYRVRRYAEALVERGDSVDAFALAANGGGKKDHVNGVNLFRIQQRKFDEKGPLSYLFRILVFFFKGAFLVTVRHAWRRYKIIHIHNVPDFLVFMAVIPKLFGARIILDIHDILPEFYCQKFGNGIDTLLARSLLLVEKLSVRFADHVIVANDLWRRKILERDGIRPEKCTTFLNYPNLKFFEKIARKKIRDEFIMIYPGHLSYHHGVDIAIRALPIIKTEIPKAVLHIYCASWILKYRQFLEDMVRQLDIRTSVKFFPAMRIEELAKKYVEVDVGIVTKREGIFSSEAFSTKIFDYMAAGVPVVTSRTKIDEYYFDDGMVMFFKPEDHEDLAKCIIKLYKNPEFGRKMINKAKGFVEKNTWEEKKRLYLNIVDSLFVNKHTNPSTGRELNDSNPPK